MLSSRLRYRFGLACLSLVLACSGERNSSIAPLAPGVDQVSSIAAAALDELNIPALGVAVMQDDELLLSRGYGRGDVTLAGPVVAETVFQLGSIGKQFLAALALRLAEQGRISLEDAVTRHLPEFKLCLFPQHPRI